MKIAIIGGGAIGSVVAAYLTKAGQDTTLIGRDDQVEAVRAHGLKILGVRGDKTIKVKILPRLDRPYDLVIFAVKTQDLDAAVNANKEYLKGAMALSTQNGVQADHLLKTYFSEDALFSSIVMFGSTYVRPGEITFNFEGDWIVGKPFGPVDSRTKEIAEILKTAFPVVVAENIIGMKWLKLFVNFNNCLPALVGKSMQETFADMELCQLSILLLKEGVDVVEKAKIELVSLPQFPVERILGLARMPVEQAAGIIHKTLTTLSKTPLYGSILQSVMRQRASEIDYINGEIISVAQQHNLKAPLNQKIVAMVHEVEATKIYFSAKAIKDKFGIKEAVGMAGRSPLRK